jgi:hypothetical protein
MLANSIFNGKYQTKKALNLIRWIIIVYTLLQLGVALFIALFTDSPIIMQSRVMGAYGLVYISMLFFSMIFPLILINKKLGMNFVFVLVTAFLMKLGYYVERLVILTTSTIREYSSLDEGNLLNQVVTSSSLVLAQGILIALFLLITLELLKKKTAYN